MALLTGLMLSVPPARAQEAPRSQRLVDAIAEPLRGMRRNPAAQRPTAAPVQPARLPVAPTGAMSPILFSVNFDADCSQDPPAPPPSPPSPYATPLGFTVHNVDARTPAGSVSYVTNAWIVREDFSFNVADCVMFSTSWYSPAGAADDWAVFPTAAAGPLAITPTTELRWNAVTYDPSYRDGYEVRYSTAGTMPADFLANPALLTIGAENTAWTPRVLSLAALAGQNIHLAFRNNSNDKFLLLLDDIVVENVAAFDPELTGLSQSPNAGYARVPVSLGYPFDLAADIANDGTSALTNVEVQVDVLVDGAPTAMLASTPVGLAAGASQTVAVGSGSYDQLGTWTAEGVVSASEGDAEPSDSSAAIDLTVVTANELSRAEGAHTANLGIGAGNGGELGYDFSVPVAARLDAVRMGIENVDVLPDNPDPTPDGDGVGDFNGVELQVALRSFTGGAPDALLATATVTVPSDAAIGPLDLLATFDTPYLLDPGRYLIAGVEPTTPAPMTIQIHQHPDRFELGTTWVNWPTSPFGTWANLEAFGAGFQRTPGLTAILQAAVLVPLAVDDAFQVSEDGALADSVAGNDTPSDQPANTYAVTSGPTNGMLDLEDDGTFTYTPAPDYFGSDTFAYEVCDATPDCAGATVTITVQATDDQPAAADDQYSVGPQGTVSANVADNDTPSPDGGNVWTQVTAPASGTFALQSDGSFEYTPDGSFEGIVSFQYTLCDTDDDCVQATAQIEVLPYRIFTDSFETP